MTQQLNSGHYHELADRLNLINNLIEESICEHPALMKKQKWQDAVTKIQSNISKLYQKVGSKMCDESEDFENRVKAEVEKRMHIRSAVVDIYNKQQSDLVKLKDDPQ